MFHNSKYEPGHYIGHKEAMVQLDEDQHILHDPNGLIIYGEHLILMANE